MTDIESNENLWGYRKRFQFVCRTISDHFTGRAPDQIRILDVGCGSAAQLGLPLAAAGYKLTGIDIHESSIEKARSLTRDYQNAEFRCERIEDVVAAPFDVVILSEVLEHVEQPEILLNSARRHLKPDGIMVVTVPNGFGEFEWDSWVFRGLRIDRLYEKYRSHKTTAEENASTENEDSGHIQFFTQKRLERIFDSCGLKVVEKRGSTLVSGPILGHPLKLVPGFIEWNARIADKFPMSFTCGWYYALRAR